MVNVRFGVLITRVDINVKMFQSTTGVLQILYVRSLIDEIDVVVRHNNVLAIHKNGCASNTKTKNYKQRRIVGYF